MQHIAGGDSMIDDMITKAQLSAVIMVHQLGQRTSALLVKLDDGRTVLLDTGSLHTIMMRTEWQRLFDEGTTSGLVPKTDGITFISATGDDDLGYTHWAVVNFPVTGTTRKVLVRVADNMEQAFPVLLGLDDLAAAKGITNHINSVVIFRDDAGVDHQYPFEPVVLQAPVLPASVASVAPAKTSGAKRRSTKTRPARAVLRTAAAWSSTLGLLLTAVEHANLATTPTGFFLPPSVTIKEVDSGVSRA